MFRTQLGELNLHIQEETAKVMNELSKVEPAVQDAKAAVRSIKKQHLVEIRAMANPPSGTSLTFFDNVVFLVSLLKIDVKLELFTVSACWAWF